MSMEQITQIATLASAIATVCAIVIVAIITLARLIHKAKQADSDGGVKITAKEKHDILMALLPFGVKILELVSKTEEKKESEETKSEEKVELDERG